MAVADILYRIGILHLLQNKTAEAELVLSRALKIKEKILGSEHQAVATIILWLGKARHHQGKNAEAENLLKRSSQIFQKTSGSDSIEFASSVRAGRTASSSREIGGSRASNQTGEGNRTEKAG